MAKDIDRPAASVAKTCPFLGLLDDASTQMSFPSEVNCCHHARPVEAVRLEHQRRYCLTSRHSRCDLFNLEKAYRLPRELRVPTTKKKRKMLGRYLLWILLTIVIIVIVVLYAQGYIFKWPGWPPAFFMKDNTNETPTTQMELPDPTNGEKASSSASQMLEPTPSLTAPVSHRTDTPAGDLINTEVVEPTLDPALTLLLQPEKDIQIRSDPAFVIHKVHKQENITLYAQYYDTTAEAILHVNADLQVPLWADNIIIIPVGCCDVFDLPAFQAYMNDSGVKSLEEIAAQWGVDLEDLSRYNGISENEIVEVGDWLIIPRPVSEG